MSENWLLIETSSRSGRLGLARGDDVACSAELDAGRRHVRDLAAVVGSMLEVEDLRPAELTGVMVSIGPGSYTGLRVGVMSAKAFAYATGCRLVAVPTFAALAEQVPVDAQIVWVIADALQGQIYHQRFARSADGKAIRPADELRIDRAEDWLNWCNSDTWVTGPGVKVYADRLPQDCRVVAEPEREASVVGVYRAGRRIAPLSREAMFALEPLYLRGSSAEEKAKQNGPRG